MHYHVTNGENFPELNELQEFKYFLAALKDSQPITPPKPIGMELVGSNMDLI